MKYPLCKYCNKEMKIDRTEYTDIYYKCDCEDYLKEQKLQAEISDLEWKIYLKKEELSKHKSNSIYSKRIGELKNQLAETERLYRDY